MKVFTIGFTKKNAEQFFARLRQSGLKRVIDTRLNNVSQLAGFTKKDDLRFFLKRSLVSTTFTCPCSHPQKIFLMRIKRMVGIGKSMNKSSSN